MPAAELDLTPAKAWDLQPYPGLFVCASVAGFPPYAGRCCRDVCLCVCVLPPPPHSNNPNIFLYLLSLCIHREFS